MDARNVELLIRYRPEKVANGMAGVVFRDIIGVYEGERTISMDPRLNREDIDPDKTMRERIPFNKVALATRLLGILGITVLKGADMRCPAGMANFFLHEHQSPYVQPRVSALVPVAINALQEGILYAPYINNRQQGDPIVGTNNPAQGLYFQKDKVSLVKSGDLLHHSNAIFLAKVHQDNSD